MTTMKQEKIAIFRFGVIFPLLREDLEYGEKSKLIEEICAKEYEIPFSTRTKITSSTVLHWLALYNENHDFEALMPKGRSDKGGYRSLDDETVTTLKNFKEKHPDTPLTTLVKMANEEGLIGHIPEKSMSSVYRLFKEWEHTKLSPNADMRRFEMESCNDCWMLDAMVGPEVCVDDNGKKKMKRTYCFGFIDDKSRFMTHAEFYMDQKADSLLDCLWKALNKNGLPRMIFTDNGSAMKDARLQQGLADLEVNLSYAKPYKGSSKAKIERWWRTLRMQFLPLLPEDGSLTLRELNKQLDSFVDSYNKRYHSGIGCSPAERYFEDLKAIRPAPAELPKHFRKKIERTVSLARTVSIEKTLYEVPLGYAKKKLVIRYMDLNGKIEAFYNGKSIGYLKPVNLVANANAHRQSPTEGDN